MAVIFVKEEFKHGKFHALAGHCYDLPDDVVGYFKMTGWARDFQDGDPQVSGFVSHYELSPDAPPEEIVIQPDNGVLGTDSEAVG